MTLQKINIPNGQSTLAGLISVPILDRYNPKIIRIVISRFFIKKNSIFFILIK